MKALEEPPPDRSYGIARGFVDVRPTNTASSLVSHREPSSWIGGQTAYRWPAYIAHDRQKGRAATVDGCPT